MSEERFKGVTTRQLCYLLKDAKKFTADEYPEWRREAAQGDCVAIEAECARRDAELAALRARLAALEPLASAAVAYGDSKGKRWSEIESSIYVMCDAAIAFAELARAQAQDGAA